MFHRKPKQVLTVVGITVPQEWYDAVVKERDALKAQLEEERASHADTEKLRANAFAAYDEKVGEVTVLKQALEEWKAKAQHRKAPAKTVQPE